MKTLISFLLFMSFIFVFSAQKVEEVNQEVEEVKDKKEKIPYLERDSLYRIHSPRKALLLSVFAPGAGQIYNKKYLKAGIVWAGLATTAYFISFNTKEYNRFKKGFIAISDDDSSTINNSGIPNDQLQDFMETYRKYKEISYIVLGGVYVLTMLDAYVDGYLYHFDINDKLTAGINPYFGSSSLDNPFQAGFSLTLNFK